jgi:hypothetical protein
LEWQEQADALTFTTATATHCKRAVASGVSSMVIDPRCIAASAFPWPGSGQVVIDGGLATHETITYSAIAGAVITFSTTTTQAHALGAELELVGGPGLGWGDNTNPATGGEFAGAGGA